MDLGKSEIGQKGLPGAAKGMMEECEGYSDLLFVHGAAVVSSLVLACSIHAAALGSEPIAAPSNVEKADVDKIRTTPSYKEAVKHYNRAVELHQAGSFNKAIVEYKLALALDDQVQEGWCNLAIVYFTNQNYKAALEAIMHAESIKPEKAITLDYYGQILFALGRDEEALTKFQRAIVVEPNFKNSYYNKADVLRRTGHDDEAKEVLEKLPKI